jgi:hypothetical protein
MTNEELAKHADGCEFYKYDYKYKKDNWNGTIDMFEVNQYGISIDEIYIEDEEHTFLPFNFCPFCGIKLS